MIWSELRATVTTERTINIVLFQVVVLYITEDRVGNNLRTTIRLWSRVHCCTSSKQQAALISLTLWVCAKTFWLLETCFLTYQYIEIVVAEVLAILSSMCEGISIIAREVCLYATRSCSNSLSHWSSNLIIRQVSTIQCIVITEQRLNSCKCQALDWSKLLIKRHIQCNTLTWNITLRDTPPRHSDTTIEELSCSVALDHITVIIERIVIRSIVRQSHTGSNQWVIQIDSAIIIPCRVYSIILHTKVRAVTNLEELVKTCIDTSCQCRTAHVWLLNQTILLVVVEREIVVHSLTTTLQCSIDIRCWSWAAQQLITPVGADTILAYQVSDIVANRLTDQVTELDVLLWIHHSSTISSWSRNTILSLYCHLNRLVVLTLLAGDNDNTVSSTRTIDSCRSSILQYGDISNIRRVQCAEEAWRNRWAIENEQWLVRWVDRVDTTQTDRSRLWRVTSRSQYRQTWNLTSKRIGKVRGHDSLQLLLTNVGNSTNNRTQLLSSTITGDDNLLEWLTFRVQQDVHLCRCLQSLGNHTNVWNLQLSIRLL